MATSYVAGIQDLLVGDLKLGSNIDVSVYIEAAAGEMTACLSPCYETPLPVVVTDEGDQSILRYIHQHLATSRLIMALAGSTGDDTNSQYAEYLDRMAREKIATVCGPTATTQLNSVPRRDTSPSTGPGSTPGAFMPGVVETDSESAVESFYQITQHGRTRGWRTGQ